MLALGSSGWSGPYEPSGSFISFAILVRVPVVAIVSGALTLRLGAEHSKDKLHATQCGDTTYKVYSLGTYQTGRQRLF